MHEWSDRGRAEGFLRYECVETSAGRLLVVMSDQGVVDVILGDERSEMLAHAERRFPGRTFTPDCGVHAEWVAAVVKRVEMPEYGALITIDMGFGYQLPAAG